MKEGILADLKALSFQDTFPDKTPYSGISLNSVVSIAEKFGTDQKKIEIMALDADIIPERYVRNMKSFSVQDQSLLLSKSVFIVGLGGLGGNVTEMMARMGIGKLVIVDGDTFEESNLNRQLLSSEKDIGQEKAKAAKKRVKEINSSINVESHHQFLTDENASFLIQNVDIVIDCLDNLKTRFIVEKAARAAGIPFVSGAVAGSTGQLTTIYPEDRGLAAIYGNPDHLPEKGIETSIGTLSYAVTLVATLECAEVIKVLLQKGEPLRNKLLIVNPKDNLYEIMTLTE